MVGQSVGDIRSRTLVQVVSLGFAAQFSTWLGDPPEAGESLTNRWACSPNDIVIMQWCFPINGTA